MIILIKWCNLCTEHNADTGLLVLVVLQCMQYLVIKHIIVLFGNVLMNDSGLFGIFANPI